MSYGVIRKIDKLGNIEIPVNIRRALDIEAGAMMNITKVIFFPLRKAL